MTEVINVYEQLRKLIPRRMNIMSEPIQTKVEYHPTGDLTVHPAAEYFPKMGTSDFNAFAADVKKNGIQEPIIINGQREVLDGRHRLEACKKAGINPVPTRFYEGDEKQIMDYVISANLKRRHLRESGRAIIAARLQVRLESGAMSDKLAAMTFRVGVRSVQRAKAVERDGCPALKDLLEREVLTLGAAAEIARLPKEEQEKVVQLPPKEIREKASQLRGVKLLDRKDSELNDRELHRKYFDRMQKLVNDVRALPRPSFETLLYRLTSSNSPEELRVAIQKIMADGDEREAREKEEVQAEQGESSSEAGT